MDRKPDITQPGDALALTAHRQGLAHVAHSRALQVAALKHVRRQIDAGTRVADVLRIIDQQLAEYSHDLRTVADQCVGPMDFGTIRALADSVVADLDEGERHARAA